MVRGTTRRPKRPPLHSPKRRSVAGAFDVQLASNNVYRAGMRSEERDISIEAGHLHCVVAGSGPLVVLLHGFPEFWYGWRNQISPVAEAGFRVVAPDLRGYDLSFRPRGATNYRMEALVEDVVGLVHAVGAGRCILVGHDWGGMVAWFTAMRHPELVERLIIMNCPHPVPFRRELTRPAQKKKSSYMAFFQLPWLPEFLMRASDFRRLRKALKSLSSNPNAFNEEDMSRYVHAWSQKGALTAMLNYYRAMRTRPADKTPMQPIRCPTMLIWGQRDPVFVPEVFEDFAEWVPDLRLEKIPEASHFVQADAPDIVNKLIIEFARA
jgi:pimeloyl-ACP methyl ester carboxylesterase